MKYMALVVIVVLSSVQAMHAQEDSTQIIAMAQPLSDQLLEPRIDLRTRLIMNQLSDDQDLVLSDSLPRSSVSRLLPKNISFMEKGLWGEDGFFRKIGWASPLTAQSRESELKLRREMLVAHQIGGFVTLGLMTSAVIAGQKIIDGNAGYRPYHKAFVAGTIATYSLTGLLAILSPPPLIRRDEFSTITVHKTLAWIHAAGMIITPILGSMIHRRSTVQQERVHQLFGYITTATFAAAMISVTF